MHGGAKGSGGPLGKRNGNFKHGLCTRKAKPSVRRCEQPFGEIERIRPVRAW